MSMNPRKGTVTLPFRGRNCMKDVSDEHESSEGDCDTASFPRRNKAVTCQMSMNPRKGTVTRWETSSPVGPKKCQMSMNPRKGTVTGSKPPRIPAGIRSDEHESSEGDCDTHIVETT